MEKDVWHAIDYCDACQRLKRGRPLDTTAHHEAQGLFPLDCVHIDVMEMNSTTDLGCTAILTMMAHDTRFNILVALQSL